MANKLPITKRLGDEIFVWDPTAFQSKGYWYILGKTGAYGRPASSAEKIKLGSPSKAQTNPVSPKVVFMDSPQLSQGSGKGRRYRKKRKLAGQQDFRTGPLKEIIFQKWFNDGTPISEAIQQALSEKFKAKVATIKDKFDPLNMVTKLVGDKVGAIIGRKMGRSEEDIERFTGYGNSNRDNEDEKDESGGKLRQLKGKGIGGIPNLERATYSSISEGQQKRLNKGSGLADVLARTYNILKKSYDEENKKSKASDKSKETKDKWHRELIEAITGKKVVGGNKKLTMSKEGDAFNPLEFLESFLHKAGWLKYIRLGPAMGMVSLLALPFVAAFLLQKLANNKNDDKALSPAEAQAILAGDNEKLIDKSGGREALEDIIKNGKQKAQAVMDMPDGTPEEKEAKKKAMRDMGGEKKVKEIAEDTKEYSVPEKGKNSGMVDKFRSKKDYIGTGQAAAQKEREWNERWAPYYNDDGTKKKPTESETPAPVVPAQPVEKPVESPVTAVPVVAEKPVDTAVKVIEKINEKTIGAASTVSSQPVKPITTSDTEVNQSPEAKSVPTVSEAPTTKDEKAPLDNDTLSDVPQAKDVPSENNTGSEVSAATSLNQDLSSTNNSGAIVSDNSRKITIINQNNDGLLVEELTGVRLDEPTFRKISRQNLHMV
jgi:hypothetical protein